MMLYSSAIRAGFQDSFGDDIPAQVELNTVEIPGVYQAEIGHVLLTDLFPSAGLVFLE